MAAPRRAHSLGAARRRALVIAASISLTGLWGCGGAVSHLFDVRGATSSTTTTAVLQVAAPLTLTVTPTEAPAGTSFHLRASGLAPTDVVTFAIAAQGGHPYVGPPHSPASDGTVLAVYETAPTDTVGLYVVLAHTANGRGAYATFHVGPPSAGP